MSDEADLEPSMRLLEEALGALRDIKRQGQAMVPSEDDTQGRPSRPQLRAASTSAQVGRQLLFAAHLAARAGREIEKQYWTGRGFPDPLSKG